MIWGRRSGRRLTFPVVIPEHEGQRYLVAMLGRAIARHAPLEQFEQIADQYPVFRIRAA
jgi:hypothetical protein